MNKLITPGLMLVTEPSNKLPWIVSEALQGGVTIVQWRQKTGVGSGFNRAYASLCAIIQDAVPLVANTVWTTAEKLRPTNVHLPEKSVPTAAARKLVGTRGLIGKSVHSVESAITAQVEGADYLIAGTVFSSPSHPEIEPFGSEYLAKICGAVALPIFAIGGITVDNIQDCIDAGASGVAVLSAIMKAKDPAAISNAYRSALEKAWTITPNSRSENVEQEVH